jgi:hypothetical protein
MASPANVPSLVPLERLGFRPELVWPIDQIRTPQPAGVKPVGTITLFDLRLLNFIASQEQRMLARDRRSRGKIL